MHQILQSGPRVSVNVIVSSATVWDLGIYLNCDVNMRSYVSKVMSSCFAVLRRLRSICSSVTRQVFVSLVVSTLVSIMDQRVTALLHDLHWLRFPERIDYKLAVLIYRCLYELAPSYLTDEFVRVSEIGSRRNLWSLRRPISSSSFPAEDTRRPCIPCGSGSTIFSSVPKKTLITTA